MAFVDDLRDRAVELGTVAAAKSRQVAEIAKLNLSNVSEESAIRKAYQEIGKLYYAERGLAPEEGYAALCEKITASKTTIEENRSRIAELREEVGKTQETPADDATAAPEGDGAVEDFFEDVSDLLEGEEKAPAAPEAPEGKDE